MLARKTLIHEWPRFLPAVVAVAFSGLLLLAQAGLVLGIFGNAAVYITGSNADLWIGSPGTQSIDQGLPLSPEVELPMRMDPAVAAIEPFYLRYAEWRNPEAGGGMSVAVSGIDVRPQALLFAKVLSADLRARLAETGTIIVDRADLDKLGARLGGQASLNGHPVRIVGVTRGLRALDGANVLASADTARLISAPGDGDLPTYFAARLRDPRQAETVRQRLSGHRSFGAYEVWTSEAFSKTTQLYWLLQTGAGAGVLFLAGVVFLAGAAITSQTLIAAIAGSLRAYATLKAMGVSAASLRNVVLQQAFGVGVTGVALAALLCAALLAVARHQNVPVRMTPGVALICGALVMAIALISGLLAVRRVQKEDPASLLR
ncbi:FtsX-like permease family protein [Pigmentiphaga humi]|uniref:FtsX-like permease family protein n=1 Tax=Pigmentiphaga humi TaxID=2478468 RepID=A0A3P4AZ15_9BURK|nr:ABC transporter permease [Pigmentiphaga humi]VCU69319.1 FtsX-like permease family protein [Pigmentiphaga humi]